MSSNGRTGHKYRQLVANVKRRGDPCWLCGHPIDWDALPRTRHSFSLDHIIPLNKGGALLDPDNAATAHYGCNSSKKDSTARPKSRTSRAW